jgi:hypothetical protein
MRLIGIGALVGAMLFGGGSAVATAEDASFTPASGGEVVVYTHRFKAENFEEGVRIVEDGFTAAQREMGQVRLNYFLVDSSNHEVVVVSFFGDEESVDEWHKFMGRLDVLEKLEPLRREPLKLERFTIHAITTSP